MEQNIQDKEFNSKIKHILYGEIITLIIISVWVYFISSSTGWSGYFLMYPFWLFFIIFLIYVIRGISSSLKMIKIYKSNNLLIPKSLKVLRLLSIFLLIVPFVAVFILLKYVMGIPIVLI